MDKIQTKILRAIVISGLIIVGISTFLPFYTEMSCAGYFITYDFSLKLLLLILLSYNIFFFLSEKWPNLYCAISALLSVLLAAGTGVKDHSISHYYKEASLISICFTLALLILLFTKAEFQIVFLINCFLILLVSSWYILTHIDFFKSYIPPITQTIADNIKIIHQLAGPGFFLAVAGVLITIVSCTVLLVLEKRSQKQKA